MSYNYIQYSIQSIPIASTPIATNSWEVDIAFSFLILKPFPLSLHFGLDADTAAAALPLNSCGAAALVGYLT
jgi:hypothetical protein